MNDANDNNTVSNVTVQLGGTAFLHCKVRNLAERTVSDAEVRKQLCNLRVLAEKKTLKRSDRFSTNGRIESQSWLSSTDFSHGYCASFRGFDSFLQVVIQVIVHFYRFRKEKSDVKFMFTCDDCGRQYNLR